MKIRILASIALAGALWLAVAPNAVAWWRGGYRYGYHYGGWGRSAYYGRYNAWNGGYYHGGVSGYNPYTSRYGASRSFYNPYTGRYGSAQLGYNPYTNRYAYHYSYGY